MVNNDGTGGPSSWSNVVLTTAADLQTPIPFTANMVSPGAYLLVPNAPLVAYTAYVLTDQNVCTVGVSGPSVTFTAGAAAPLPTALGALDAAAPQFVAALSVGTSSGACSTDVMAATISIDLQPTPEAAAWLDVLHFETLVDGVPWRGSGLLAPGTTRRGRGRDSLYRICSSTDPLATGGLSAGTHQVAMRATLPGTGMVLMTDAITVELLCESDPPPECAADPAACEDNRDGDSGCTTSGRGGLLLVALVGLFCTAHRRRRL
jgi:hypothetical protein